MNLNTNTTPARADATKDILCGMENGLLTIKDLGNAVCAIAECNSGITAHVASALNRLGYLIAETAGEVERDREAAWHAEMAK